MHQVMQVQVPGVDQKLYQKPFTQSGQRLAVVRCAVILVAPERCRLFWLVVLDEPLADGQVGGKVGKGLRDAQAYVLLFAFRLVFIRVAGDGAEQVEIESGIGADLEVINQDRQKIVVRDSAFAAGYLMVLGVDFCAVMLPRTSSFLKNWTDEKPYVRR
jgi:hypothetical protein